MFLAFALAGFVTCEWLLAATDVADRKPRKITFATWNLEEFFDDVACDDYGEISKKLVDSPRNEWECKKKAVAKVNAEIQATMLSARKQKDLKIQSAVVYPGLVIQGWKDTNHWESYYKFPQSERELSDHYPLVVTFSFK